MMEKKNPLSRFPLIFIFISDISHSNSYAAAAPPSLVLLIHAGRHC